MWAKAIDQRQYTVLDPNNRIKAAIMRARERSHIERVRSRQRGGGSDRGVLDEVRELQKSVLMAQLQQLNSGLAAQSAAPSSGWVPFKYEF